jgi:phospholipid/cholesterol/gamma-HCH transport system substrate-binding protein
VTDPGSRGLARLAMIRALGVVFLVLILASVWLTYAVFAKKFVDVVPVRLQTSSIGLQLQELADVKIRGVIVGEVREMHTDGSGGAVLDLALDPEDVGMIPANVNAAIVPKTLFGQKYVALQVPANPAEETLSSGDVIEDTQAPLEAERVMANTYPLLRTVRPADLSATLNAMATALEGRGERLGDNLVRLDGYLKKLNPQVPGIVENLRLLSTVSDNYAEVMPELGRLLRNQARTGDTLVEKEEELRALFTDVAGFSDTTRGFLEVNEENIIRLGEVSVPTLNLLERYSPEYPCLFQGMSQWVPRGSQVWRDRTLHINLETLPYQPQGYTPADTPEYGAEYGPSCATLPSPPYSQTNPGPQPGFFAGEEDDDGIAGSKGKYRTAPGFASGWSAGADTGSYVTSGWAGTATEQKVVDALAAPVLGVPAERVPDVTTLLLGPLARGTEVTLR